MGDVVNLNATRGERERTLVEWAQHLLGVTLEPWQIDMILGAGRTRKPVVAHQINGSTCEIIVVDEHAV